jgi:hypothetical protein
MDFTQLKVASSFHCEKTTNANEKHQLLTGIHSVIWQVKYVFGKFNFSGVPLTCAFSFKCHFGSKLLWLQTESTD